MDFNTFDAIIISVTLLLAIKGFFTGFIKEIAGLIGIAGGVFLGSLYYHQIGIYINEHIFKISNESAINVVGFVSIFILTWLFVLLVGLIFVKILSAMKLGIMDRLAGVVFSAGKFFLIVAVIVTMLSQIEALKLDKYAKNSITYPYLLKTGKFLIHIKPEEVKKQIDDVKQKVSEKISPTIKKTIEETKEKVADSIAKEVKPQIQKAIDKAKGE